LVGIYKNEDLATLQAYHAYLFSNIDFTKNGTASVKKMELSISPDAYLIKEKAKLEKELKVIRNKHTYLVLTTYKDPSAFIGELRSYYQDRMNKLKRRTRTKDWNKTGLNISKRYYRWVINLHSFNPNRSSYNQQNSRWRLDQSNLHDYNGAVTYNTQNCMA